MIWPILKNKIPRAGRTYFDATWDFWKRQINQNLWDWAVDGPFCKDPACGQRLKPTPKTKNWKCIRCGKHSEIPGHDLVILRNRVIIFFEEEARAFESSGSNR